MKNNTHSKKLKVLTEFNNDSHKSLLVELEKNIVDQLQVDANGEVNVVDFIMACLVEYGVEIADTPSKPEISLEQLIFDTSIAVDARKRQ